MIVQDKVAIVTGASSGIGEATAKILTAHGAKVVLAARSKDKLDELSKTLKDSFSVPTDVKDVEALKNLVKKTIEHFGRLDILVNNAGLGYDIAVEKIDPSLYTELFQVNLLGPLILMQEAIPHMRETGEGSIINVSSGTSLMNIPNLAAYSSIKRALNGVSLTARTELEKDNIKVSIVYPYITNTNFGKNVMSGPRKELPRDGGDVLPAGDPPELVAEKILEVIESGDAEILAHDWMRDIR